MHQEPCPVRPFSAARSAEAPIEIEIAIGIEIENFSAIQESAVQVFNLQAVRGIPIRPSGIFSPRRRVSSEPKAPNSKPRTPHLEPRTVRVSEP
jgi:hypothetical protein